MPSVTDHGNYTEYVLAQGETYHHSGGSLLENALFDVTADDCELRIDMSGSGWTVRNVGVRGTLTRGDDHGQYGGNGSVNLINAPEANSGDENRVEHCYFGDGVAPGTNKRLLIQSSDHAGHLEVQDCNIQEWNHSTVYAAGMARLRDPGQTDGAGGTVGGTRCYFKNNNMNALRIASDGSYLQDCVIWAENEIPWMSFNGTSGSSQDLVGRGLRVSYGDPQQTVFITDCHIYMPSSAACPPNYGSVDNCGAVAIQTGTHGTYGDLSAVEVNGGHVVGATVDDGTGLLTMNNVGSDPVLEPPSTVPTSALEAATEGGASTERLTVESADGSTQEYELTFEGEVALTGSSANTDPDDSFRDTVTDHGDGTFTIHGWVASGTDDFHVDVNGSFTAIDASDAVEFTLGGEAVTHAELLGSDAPTVDPPENLAVTATGQTTVDVSWEPPGSIGASGTNSLGSTGGGSDYVETFEAADADATASTLSELQTALAGATSGDVVFVDGSASIEIVDEGSDRITVPSGVTLASNRGVGGAVGGLIFTDQSGGDWRFYSNEGLVNLQSGARVTGLRVRGALDPNTQWMAQDYDFEDAGIVAQGSDAEIDNCEVFHHTYGVFANDGVHIHHCHIHHANIEGTGYGIHANGTTGSLPVIEYNRFAHCRHMIADGGGGGYEVRHCVFEPPVISHVIDQHMPGGTTMEVHHNTIEAFENDQGSFLEPGFVVRGIPDDVADLHHNWFHNPDPPRDDPQVGDEDRAIVQIEDETAWDHYESWQNVTFSDNHYGSTSPPGGASVDHYAVYVDGAQVDTVAAGTTTYQFAGLDPATEYDLGVSVVDTEGDESATTTVTQSTDVGDPITAPQNLTAPDTTVDTIDLDWDVPVDVGPGVDHYTISVNGTEDHTVAHPITETQVTGLFHSTSYDLAVTAVDTDGTESAAATVTASTAEPEPITAPQNLAVANTSTDSVSLTWDEPEQVGTGVNTYRVYVETALDHDVGSGTTTTVTGLDADTEYDLAVTAVDEEGAESSPATVVAVTEAPGQVGSPDDLTVTARTETAITLDWTPPDNTGSGIDFYRVYRDGVIHESIVTATSFELVGLDAGTAYTLEVTTFDTDSNESASALVAASTLAAEAEPPEPPSALVLSDATTTSLVFDLSPPSTSGSSPLSHYNVSVDGVFDHQVAADDTVVAVHGLSPDTEYTVGVTAVNESDLESAPTEATTRTDASDGHGGTPVGEDDPGCGFGDIL